MRKAFEEIYEQTRSKIFNYIRRRVNSKEDAEDLTQDVFYKVLRAIHKFRDKGIEIESWIYTIARNRIIDFTRQAQRVQKKLTNSEFIQMLPSEDPDLLEYNMHQEDQLNLFKAISELPSKDQYLLYYKYFAELPINEIADKTGLSETNIGTKLFRLRKRLAELLNSKNDITQPEKLATSFTS